jgi:hypothetical protein
LKTRLEVLDFLLSLKCDAPRSFVVFSGHQITSGSRGKGARARQANLLRLPRGDISVSDVKPRFPNSQKTSLQGKFRFVLTIAMEHPLLHKPPKRHGPPQSVNAPSSSSYPFLHISVLYSTNRSSVYPRISNSPPGRQSSRGSRLFAHPKSHGLNFKQSSTNHRL